MRLLWPWAVPVSLAIVCLFAAIYIVLRTRRKKQILRFTNVELLSVIAPGSGSPKAHYVALVFLLGMTILGFATGRPVIEFDVSSSSATVVLAIDVSLSMEATDMVPDRLSAARSAAREFLSGVPKDLRVGLVTFSGTAQVLVPPTRDHSAVASALSRIRTGLGTAIGEGIFAAMSSIVASSSQESSGAASILLMSDGENTVGRDPIQAAYEAEQSGIKVSTVAIGTESGTIVYRGQQIVVAVNEAQLRQIAISGGGAFFRAASEEDLTAVYRNLSREQATERRIFEVTAIVAAFAGIFLILAALLSLLWFQRFL